jgi:hypothetical protein
MLHITQPVLFLLFILLSANRLGFLNAMFLIMSCQILICPKKCGHHLKHQTHFRKQQERYSKQDLIYVEKEYSQETIFCIDMERP